MKNLGKTLTVASSVALLLALGACGDRTTSADANGNPAAQQQGPAVAGDIRPETDTTARPADTNVMGSGGQTGMVDDAQIVVKINTALAADADLSALQINVDSDKGVVTLRGTAPDPAAKERAAEIARNVTDVKSVNNQLTLG